MFGHRYSAGGALVALVVVLLVKFSNRSDAGEEYLASAKEMAATIPCYKQNVEYVDWLVTDAHDHCFNDSYTMNYSRRGRSRDTVDEGRYLHDLFDLMIERAKADRAEQVVTELTKLRTEVLSIE